MSMVAFVLEEHASSNDFYESFLNCINYANFLKQPLNLSMFVPCDLEGNVLEEDGLMPSYERLQYLEAKERVLFEGIEFVEAKQEGHHSFVRICKSLSTINYPSFWLRNTVEDLIPYNLKLTTTALKQIGL